MELFGVGFLQNAGVGAAWLVTGCLVVSGLAGCVLPVLPGHLLIFLAAVAQRWMLGSASGVACWTFLVLGLLLAASQVFEFVSGAAGSRWFGGTRWGAFGAIAGGILGMFFFPFGLVLGPLIGAVLCELIFAKKATRIAVNSGVGSAVGALAGSLVKVAVGLAMTGWLLIDIFLIT